jgi:hypothetical protein
VDSMGQESKKYGVKLDVKNPEAWSLPLNMDFITTYLIKIIRATRGGSRTVLQHN